MPTIGDFGQDQRHHGEIDALQAQDRQADQHAEGAEQAGERNGEPEGNTVFHDQDGRDIPAGQRKGALPDIDAADIEGQPHAALAIESSATEVSV